MQSQVNFSYFYGEESEQFSYFRIPRLLVRSKRFKTLSTEAKLLYGLMLDRMGLSAKHGGMMSWGAFTSTTHSTRFRLTSCADTTKRSDSWPSWIPEKMVLA